MGELEAVSSVAACVKFLPEQFAQAGAMRGEKLGVQLEILLVEDGGIGFVHPAEVALTNGLDGLGESANGVGYLVRGATADVPVEGLKIL